MNRTAHSHSLMTIRWRTHGRRCLVLMLNFASKQTLRVSVSVWLFDFLLSQVPASDHVCAARTNSYFCRCCRIIHSSLARLLNIIQLSGITNNYSITQSTFCCWTNHQPPIDSNSHMERVICQNRKYYYSLRDSWTVNEPELQTYKCLELLWCTSCFPRLFFEWRIARVFFSHL